MLPVFSRTHKLSLDLREAQLNEPCVTNQGISLTVNAVSVFKVGDDEQSISNAARRFLDQQNQMQSLVGQILAGHLRSIVGGMTVEQIIRDRNALAQQVKDSSTSEMEKMGLTIDSFQIREIEDPSNYIGSLAAPHIAEVQKTARIAQAQADQAANEQEQIANAAKAGYERDSHIAQAEADGLAKAAQAKAAQQGPLAEAAAQQDVAAQNALLASKQAEVREAQLDAEVRRPADAAKYQVVTAAEADRDATRAKAEAAEAQAKQITVLAEAEAGATKVKNDALADGNLERQVATQLVSVMPDIVKGLADGLRGSHLTILNGTEGVGEMLTGLVTTGKTIYQALVTDATHPAIAGGVSDPAAEAAALAANLESTIARKS